MSQTADNTSGKQRFICTCGIRVNLDPHEYPDWMTRHATHYAGQEHKLEKLLEAPSTESVQLRTLEVLDNLSKKMQLEDKGVKK